MTHFSFCGTVGLAAAGLMIVLAGCAPLDPMVKQGEWRPSGANQANLVAMVADPADLTRGVDTAPVDGQQAAAAVARLRQGNVKKLPDSGLAELRLQAGDNQAAPSAPGTGGS